MKKISHYQLQKKINEVNILFSQGNISASENLLNELIDSFPNHPDVLSKLGTIYLYQEKLNDGISLIKKSLSINSFQPELLKNYAVALLNIGKPDEALKAINQSIKLNPNYADTYYHNGIICKELNLLDNALIAYKKAIGLDPNHLYARINAAVIFIELKNYSFALNLLAEALQICNTSAGIHYNLGLTYLGLKKFDFALDSINKAISINPDYIEAYNVKGLALKNLFLYDEALINFDKAISLDPNFYEAYNNKGLALEEIKAFDQAILAYTKAADNDIYYEDPKYNLALLLLSTSEFSKGWPLYKNRPGYQEFIKSGLASQKPYLEKLPLDFKSILIIGEQGLGDQILFSSILDELLKLNYKLTVTIDKRLISLFKRSFKTITFLSIDSETNKIMCDYQVLMGDLLKFFRNSESDFLKQKSPFLIANKNKSVALNTKKNNQNKLICGISWLSKNKMAGDFKSLSLEQLAPILNLPNIIFIDLQYGETSEEKLKLKEKFNIHIHKVDNIDNFNDIDKLCSQIDACDFILTISNVTAHLAGAMGKKTYLMPPFSIGKVWYWHENHTKSLWYPSISIFKQEKINDWQSVVKKIKEDIESIYLND